MSAETRRTPPRLASGGVKAVAAWMACSVVLGIAGCQAAPVPPPPLEDPRATAKALVLDAWLEVELDCEAARCAQWIRVETASPGELRVDVHAPTGPAESDFDLRVLFPDHPHVELVHDFFEGHIVTRKSDLRSQSAGDYIASTTDDGREEVATG